MSLKVNVQLKLNIEPTGGYSTPLVAHEEPPLIEVGVTEIKYVFWKVFEFYFYPKMLSP
jgi:hypothetical protein